MKLVTWVNETLAAFNMELEHPITGGRGFLVVLKIAPDGNIYIDDKNTRKRVTLKLPSDEPHFLIVQPHSSVYEAAKEYYRK